MDNTNKNLVQFRTEKPHEKTEYMVLAQELNMEFSDYCREALRYYTNMRRAALVRKQARQERAAS